MAPKERTEGSEQARERLAGTKTWERAKAILFYAPLAQEVDLWPLVASALAGGKAVALPRFCAETREYVPCQIRDPQTEIRQGRFGIREPTEGCPVFPLMGLDLTLVPGVSFSLSGFRLGRGAGHYDRLLKFIRGVKCGVGFDQQVLHHVPVEPHDICLDRILTPTRWIEVQSECRL